MLPCFFIDIHSPSPENSSSDRAKSRSSSKRGRLLDEKLQRLLDAGETLMRNLLVAVLLLGLAAGADSPKDWDDTTTTTAGSPEGTWHLVRITRGGVDENPANWNMVFDGDKYSWRMGGTTAVVEGNYKIDLNRTPAQLDLMPEGSFKATLSTNVFSAWTATFFSLACLSRRESGREVLRT
jgi:uncharacterized protein (TIGR03067 family)